jgi:hypothetical protein
VADTLKILGQSKPSAATATTLYTVPAATSAVISTIVVCNQSSVATSFRISLTPTGGTDDQTQQFLYYDVIIPGNDTFVLTLGISLEATAKIRIYATLATLSFTAVGVEIT